MKALIFVGATMAVSFCLGARPALAEPPRFARPPSAVCAGTDLAVSFELLGLGRRLQVQTFTSANVEVVCVLRGRPAPRAHTERMTEPATLLVDRNGEARGVVLLRVEPRCAAGLEMVVTYRGLTVEAGDREALAVAQGPFICR